ncbi:MAG: hypothetical protein C0169_01495 [Thermodesulfobacterium geofontis]|uniref:Uncharacterized protein n=1 Tax=Thermodesulfobacterium geofontis TaxID=1295609 RepID=A0A2N7QG37_9BACT|nr:MAG: hypothetical protein C0169_01495 [Thermodesulfobacterium geofontis]
MFINAERESKFCRIEEKIFLKNFSEILSLFIKRFKRAFKIWSRSRFCNRGFFILPTTTIGSFYK